MVIIVSLHIVNRPGVAGAFLLTPFRGAYFSFCGEDDPRKNFFFLAGYYFLGRINFCWGRIGKNFMIVSCEDINF